MKKFPEVKLASNATESEAFIESTERFLTALEHSLEVEVNRILREETVIGEGKAAKVFSLESSNSPCNICAKVFRTIPKRDMTPLDYRKIQYSTPEEEFGLQDEAFRAGCRIPRPIAFAKIGERDVMVMEELEGSDLKKIMDAGASIDASLWDELVHEWKKLEAVGIVHRDLAPQNIFLRTREPVKKGAILRGQIYLIDLGLSKRFNGKKPSKEDFTFTLGNNTIYYPNDEMKIEELNPKNRRTSPFKTRN